MGASHAYTFQFFTHSNRERVDSGRIYAIRGILGWVHLPTRFPPLRKLSTISY